MCAARRSRLLNMHEPASSLDSNAERDFFRDIRAMATGRTIILISHRLTALELVDTIYVRDVGRIVEHGTHEVPVARPGSYSATVAAVCARDSDRA